MFCTQHKELLRIAQSPVASLAQGRPDALVEVVYEDARDAAFAQLKAQYGTVLAFHGSPFDNFYSILHNGFCGHLNKARRTAHALVVFDWLLVLVCVQTSLFGEGTYLSKDISVSIGFTKPAEAWEHSSLGMVACLHVCMSACLHVGMIKARCD